MKNKLFFGMALGMLLIPAASSPVQAKTSIPVYKQPRITAQCKDGTYSTSKTRQGTCSHHKGVKRWF